MKRKTKNIIIITLIIILGIASGFTVKLAKDSVSTRKYKFKCVKSKEILIMHTFLCAGKKET